jgi:hypothetical protein
MVQSHFINDDRILKRGLTMNIKEKAQQEDEVQDGP